MTVLAVCGWTLAITIINEEVLETPAPDSNLTSIAGSGGSRNRTTAFVPKSGGEEEGNEGDKTWNGMTRRFKNLIQACVGASICVILIQLIVSMIVLCTSNKVKAHRGSIVVYDLQLFQPSLRRSKLVKDLAL
jgi:hypothetical protein